MPPGGGGGLAAGVFDDSDQLEGGDDVMRPDIGHDTDATPTANIPTPDPGFVSPFQMF